MSLSPSKLEAKIDAELEEMTCAEKELRELNQVSNNVKYYLRRKYVSVYKELKEEGIFEFEE